MHPVGYLYEGTGEFGVIFVVDRTMKRNVLDFKAVDERVYTSRIKINFVTEVL
jgi:hypothetical protein